MKRVKIKRSIKEQTVDVTIEAIEPPGGYIVFYSETGFAAKYHTACFELEDRFNAFSKAMKAYGVPLSGNNDVDAAMRDSTVLTVAQQLTKNLSATSNNKKELIKTLWEDGLPKSQRPMIPKGLLKLMATFCPLILYLCIYMLFDVRWCVLILSIVSYFFENCLQSSTLHSLS